MHLLLLHGALGASSQFAELEKSLTSDFDVHSINFSGHGGEAIPEEPFSIKLFAEDVLECIDALKIDVTDIFGYSMGGYVALFLAGHYPERTGKIMTVASKFHWDEQVSAREIKMLDAAKMKEKIPQFYNELEKRHAPQDLEIILQKTREMMINLGKDNELKPGDFELIKHDVTVGIGDRDKMVTLAETVDVYKKLPNGKLLVLPNTPHPFEEIDVERLVFEIKSFF
ncbi:MAG TPA: alpha/beta hydrolase [Ignavibacteria bacterium]|jgi:pimeloyl-ACP methyl ester carboxylesterase